MLKSRSGRRCPTADQPLLMASSARRKRAYFKMINDQGGINGRKINLISLDDGYSPPKTVEQVRRLVEQEQVAFLFNTLGTAPNLAIRQYLNDNKVPQLFVSTGASVFADPEHFPWTIGFNPNYQTEARIYGKHILATKPDAKICGALSERRLRQGLSDRTQGCARLRPREHDRQGSLVRDLGADRRFPGRVAARVGRGCCHFRRDAKICRAGDPQILSILAGTPCATSATFPPRSRPS